MKTKKIRWMRSLAMLLCLSMMLGITPVLPQFSLVQKAEAADTENNTFISMPITIRDYAADGMLFEFNQVGATGTTGAAGGVTPTREFTGAAGGTATSSVKDGYVRYTSSETGNYITYTLNSETRTSLRYAAIKYRTSAAYSSQPTIGHRASDGDHYVNFATNYNNGWQTAVIDLGSGTATVSYVSIFPQLASGNYIDIAYIAFFAEKADATTYNSNGGSAGGDQYNQADTANFSMLATTTADYINDLTDSSSIAGTTLIQNGKWGLKTDPDPITATLNSGATQEVYGAWIRTDLVQAKLDENGDMVYTEAAVKYIAEYMQQIMAVPEQNSDGSYNTYFVTGHELDDLGGETLAAKIRAQVTDGLGTYDEAKAKFDANSLNEYTGIETWYDAAYFLLHNIFNDNTGYGKTVSNYKNLNLIQTTNADGETCYVFNSGYDNAKYDYTNGVIYNTQTDTITIAENSSGDVYVRGNALPDARFDPLGESGAGKDLGYGKSGDTYGDMVSASTADWAEYYDNTNYNLSLEGHAQFIYYEDSDLYFTFTGDDDVYLFINGVRVLDVGAAHSISKVKINLNDVAELCGLKDGQAYDFDFFYMERHGTAANFGIETNIRIVDPAMTTTKTGYQNGVNTGYNGFVDPLVPVVYEFGLENKGESDIQNLTFTDNDIGVTLTKDDITLNSETTIADLSVTVYKADGSVKETVATGSLTEEKLKELLETGLAVNEKIVIYGFKYTIPTDKWVTDNDTRTFPNTVYTTAISIGDNNSQQNLNGMAEWKVQKREYSFQDYHVYEWVKHGVTLTKEELLQPLVDAVSGFDKSTATIEVSSASGATTGINVNTKAVLNSDGSITYIGTQTGADTFYYKVTEGAVTAVIGVAVYSYDVADNTYVLDYGLAVELNGEDFGLMVNDTLALADNPNATTAKVTGIENATSNYGDFTWADPSLKYTPDDIIDDTDSVQANVQVLEDGATELTKFTGVAMYETVTTAPANVVYYEENFPGITYVNEGENQWAHYETVDEDGNSVAGTEQSADQDSNYGSDPNYEEDKEGTWNEDLWDDSNVVDSISFRLDTEDLDALQESGIEALNEYLGYGSWDSNGTVNELVVKETADVMFFDFVGTGFEIISRTTDEQYAVINVMVDRIDTVTDEETGEVISTTYTRVTQKPVITESKGGDLYQVPIISITGLDRANYRVTVKAAGSTDNNKTRVLYIDGIRIYGPLSDDEALEYYNPEEYQAEFLEIKQLIGNGQMIYADASETDDNLQLVTGTTLVEDVEVNAVLTSIESVNEYMQVGPNNEIYLDGNGATGMIAFFLTPIEKDANENDYPESARTIEIGAHRKSDSSGEDYGEVYMTYGSTAQNIIDGTYSYTVSSGTEMYYTIDVDNLILDENGKYLVMIGTNGSENYGTTLALTNLKLAGYEISFAETTLLTADENDTLSSEPVVQEVSAVYTARMLNSEESEEETEEEIIEVIPVNENLSIVSASFKSAKVVSGKVATINVRTSAEADHIEIVDADGNILEDFERTSVSTKSNGELVFTAIWKVYGSRGDVLDYTVRAYDADGYVSVNEETLSVTIK